MKMFFRCTLLTCALLLISVSAASAMDCLACKPVTIPDPDGGDKDINTTICVLVSGSGGYECSDEGLICVIFWPCDIFGHPPVFTDPDPDKNQTALLEDKKSCSERAIEDAMSMPLVRYDA